MNANFVKRVNAFRPLRTLDGYLMREFLAPLLVLIVVFVFIFMIGDIYADLSHFLSSDQFTMGEIFSYFILKIPVNIRFVLPVSLLLACMYAMANFGKNSEITAMRASGISLVRSGASLYLIAFIVTGITFYLNEGVIPDLERAAQQIKKEARGGVADTSGMLVYMSDDRCRSWFFEGFYESNEIVSGIILHKLSPDQKIQYELRAERAVYDAKKGWTFYDCEHYMNRQGMLLPKIEKLPTFTLSKFECAETPKDIILSSKPADELPILTLLQRMENCPKDAVNLYAKYETIFYFRIAFPWACLIGVMLGIPLAAKNMRSGIMLSIINAILLVVLYLVCAQIFNMLGQKRILPPIVAGLGPTLFFFSYALYIMRKSD